MFFPFLAASSLIDLSSDQAPYEYPVRCLVEDLEKVFLTQSPCAEEFFPFLEGIIDILGFFTLSVNENIQAHHAKLKMDLLHLQEDSSFLKTILSDCKSLLKFPKLRFCHRLTAFEECVEHLEIRMGINFSEIKYEDRVYSYGAVRALNNLHEDFCTYISGNYKDENWKEYFNFDRLENFSYTFLLNPTVRSQYDFLLELSLLKAKIHNL